MSALGLSWLAGAALAAAILVLCWLPAAALAQTPPPSCPDEPAAYTGSDEVVNEVRALRVDERASCLALADRIEAVRAFLQDGTLAVRQDASHNWTVVSPALDTIASNTDPGNQPDPAEAQDVRLAGFVGDGELWVNDWNQTLWFIAGLVVGAAALLVIARQVFPR